MNINNYPSPHYYTSFLVSEFEFSYLRNQSIFTVLDSYVNILLIFGLLISRTLFSLLFTFNLCLLPTRPVPNYLLFINTEYLTFMTAEAVSNS